MSGSSAFPPDSSVSWASLPRWTGVSAGAKTAAGGPAVVVLSYEFWQRVLDGDPAALGRAIALGGRAVYRGGDHASWLSALAPVDVWTPLRASRTGKAKD